MVTKAPEKKVPRRVYTCGICGATLRDQRWVYSPTTGERYCEVPDWEACSERAAKRREK